jgi:hypothetical protein
MRATAALLVALIAAVVGAPLPVRASCMMPLPLPQALAEADLVFVGTVSAVANHDRRATVLVEEIWKGPALVPVVDVRGGGDDESMFTSADRTYTQGVRYLFVLSTDGGPLMDSACSSTQEWSPDLQAHRPSQVVTTQPDAPTDPASGSSVPLAALALGLTGVAGVALLGGAALLARRQRAGVRER